MRRGNGRDERTRDRDAEYAARAIAEAVGGSAKELAYQVGRSPRTGRRWLTADRSNPLFRAREVIERMQNPWPALLDLIAHAARREIEVGGLVSSEWAWRQAFLDASEREQETDGEEDCVVQMYLSGRATLADVRNADALHAPYRIRRLALAEIGIREGYTLRDEEDG